MVKAERNTLFLLNTLQSHNQSILPSSTPYSHTTNLSSNPQHPTVSVTQPIYPPILNTLVTQPIYPPILNTLQSHNQSILQSSTPYSHTTNLSSNPQHPTVTQPIYPPILNTLQSHNQSILQSSTPYSHTTNLSSKCQPKQYKQILSPCHTEESAQSSTLIQPLKKTFFLIKPPFPLHSLCHVINYFLSSKRQPLVPKAGKKTLFIHHHKTKSEYLSKYK